MTARKCGDILAGASHKWRLSATGRKTIFIISFLLFSAAQSNSALGEFVCPDRDPNSAWWLSMDEWISTAKNGNWFDPCN